MKRYLILTLVPFLVVTLKAQQVTHYDFDVVIDMDSKTVAVTGMADIGWGDAREIPLVLWKQSEIKSVETATGQPVDFSFDIDQTPVMYIPNGGSFTVKKPDTGAQVIYFDYVCDMAELTPWFGKSFEPQWLELGFYTAWYPVHMDSRAFTSQVTVSINGDMKLNGSGVISGSGSSISLVQNWPSSDIVILGSRELKTGEYSQGGLTAEIISVDLSDEVVAGMLEETRAVFDYYCDLLDVREDGFIKFAVPPGRLGGGYARKNFIVLPTGGYLNDFTSHGIAHEMAHFWWTGAPVTTWEDWLNESFAEYLSFKYLEKKTGKIPPYGYGEMKYDTWIELYGESTRNTPPIYGIDRDRPEAYSALYEYGSLMLYEFENIVGEEEFTGFLRGLLANDVKDTRTFIRYLEDNYPDWVAPWFAGKLGLPENFMEI